MNSNLFKSNSSRANESPKVSVVIPAYNAESTIQETIYSVLEQTLKDFEVIVINDGSTDKTLELISCIEDDRVKVFNYENGGLSTARNRGINHATGRFIAFMDADDLWTDDKLELQVKALEDNESAGVAYSWTYFMDNAGVTCHKIQPIFFEGNVTADLLTWNFVASGSNPLIRREAIDSTGFFDETVAGAADWDYWLRLASSWPYVVVPKEQIFYRQSITSMSSKVSYMEECQLKVIMRFFASSPENLAHLQNKSLSYIYRYSSKLYLDRHTNRKEVQQALKKLGQAIKIYPKTLLDRKTQKLFLKAVLAFILPEGLSTHILQKVNRYNSISIDQGFNR